MSAIARPRYRTTVADRRGTVGFYGCASGHGKLVRCVFAGEGNPPVSVKVDCPACGEVHRVTPMWRPGAATDKGRRAEVTIADRESAR
ncbi:MAG TPA: hypothetical protein VHZ54_04645 [Solirubrobacterales bacterium]|nr:hypothetical protein [Solirubrobacterales bacterium]